MKIALAIVTALAAHGALVAMVWLWPRPPQAVSQPDFVRSMQCSEVVLPNPTGSSVCPVHHIPMSIEEVPLVTGLLQSIADPESFRRVNPTEPPPSIRKARFPYAEHWAWGGCCATQQEAARVYICPDCERAAGAWRNGFWPADLKE